MTEHKLKFENGKHPRNRIARCSCGWAHANTHTEVRKRGALHVKRDSQYRWDDPRRRSEPDEPLWKAA